mmetsp:Transcript_5183/g.14236  ORF Transcript_5183/g.14236 Transcript_5183/m.14236 type:complete len:107 (+) Transcript_5183:225-545(+)
MQYAVNQLARIKATDKRGRTRGLMQGRHAGRAHGHMRGRDTNIKTHSHPSIHPSNHSECFFSISRIFFHIIKAKIHTIATAPTTAYELNMACELMASSSDVCVEAS